MSKCLSSNDGLLVKVELEARQQAAEFGEQKDSIEQKVASLFNLHDLRRVRKGEPSNPVPLDCGVFVDEVVISGTDRGEFGPSDASDGPSGPCIECENYPCAEAYPHGYGVLKADTHLYSLYVCPGCGEKPEQVIAAMETNWNYDGKFEGFIYEPTSQKFYIAENASS